MNVPRDLRYTSTHEWVKVKGSIATVGITDFAQHQLSDLTYVELPDKDDQVSASDVYSPVSGLIVEVNARVVESPELINTDPYGDGWLFKVQLSEPAEVEDLMDCDQYEEQLPEEE